MMLTSPNRCPDAALRTSLLCAANDFTNFASAIIVPEIWHNLEVGRCALGVVDAQFEFYILKKLMPKVYKKLWDKFNQKPKSYSIKIKNKVNLRSTVVLSASLFHSPALTQQVLYP